MTSSQLFFALERSGYSAKELARLSGVPLSLIEDALNGKKEAAELLECGSIKRILGLEEEVSCVREALPKYDIKRCTIGDYLALPKDERYELIDGELFRMEAPGPDHQAVLGEFYLKIAMYIRQRKGPCEVWFAPCDVQLDRDEYTMVQPDLFILCDKDKRTRTHFYGAPDFVLEILSPSTRKKDLNLKLRKYRLAGVKEYWAVDIDKRLVYVFCFDQSETAVRMREREKNFGAALLRTEEEPVIYTAEDEVPIGIFGGDLKIDMGEVFSKLMAE